MLCPSPGMYANFCQDAPVHDVFAGPSRDVLLPPTQHEIGWPHVCQEQRPGRLARMARLFHLKVGCTII